MSDGKAFADVQLPSVYREGLTSRDRHGVVVQPPLNTRSNVAEQKINYKKLKL